MAGIRTFNTNLPHVFRFPEWTEGIFYPKGSIVGEELAKNGVLYYSYYVAITDVTQLTRVPSSNQDEWRVIYEDPSLDSDLLAILRDSELVEAILGFDSELKRFKRDVDSEGERISALIRDMDSEIDFNLDSEIHDRRAGDSDLRADLDSEIHDRMAADSDLRSRFAEIDSDLAILFARTDSDEDFIQAVSTKVLQGLDSEIRARISADSDINVLIVQTVHDYLSNDSEHDSEINAIRARLDSEFDAAIRDTVFTNNEFAWGPQPYQTNTNYYRDEEELTNHILGYLWLEDHTNDKIYVILNGKTIATLTTANGAANTTTTFTDALTGEWRRGTQIEESPGDDADVSIYQNKLSALPLVTNGNLYQVVERFDDQATHKQQVDLDTAFRRTVTTIVMMDSDIHQNKLRLDRLDSDLDSDIAKLYHDTKALDSEQRILKADRDSDTLVLQRLRFDIDSERHDWKAADSDLLKALDSDLKLTLEHDSELFIQTDSEERARRDADSDIYNGYIGVKYRYIKTESTPVSFTGLPVIDFAGSGAINSISGYTGGWVWNSHNDRLVITDSDGTVLYNEIHNDEPILVEIDSETRARRTTDAGLNADIEVNGTFQLADDVWNYRLEFINQYKRFGGNPEGYLLETIFDSDLNLHDADSDKVDAFEFIGIWMQERDSDIKMEIHDRKAADSDIIDEFRIPEETVTLRNGVTTYTLTNPLLNENTRWAYRTEIEANSSIYNGVVNDHFEINHNGTAWEIEVDGVQGREYVDIFVSGSATVSGQAINLAWDDNSTVTISPLSTDSTVDIATQLYEALLDKAVLATLNTLTSSVNYSADGRINPTGITTLNGISFTFLENAVVDQGFYYKDADTITIRKK